MFLLALTATCQVWTVSLKAGLYTYNRPAADACQRPLVPRSRCQARLRPGVSLPGAAGFPNPACVEVDFIALLSYNRGSGGIAYGPCTHYRSHSSDT